MFLPPEKRTFTSVVFTDRLGPMLLLVQPREPDNGNLCRIKRLR